MTTFVGVIGSGNVGRNPFDPGAFSGASRNLFMALQSQNALARAFGVEARPLQRCALMAMNFRPSRLRWRTKFYLDTRYYRALTSAVASTLQERDFSSVILQLGAYYDVPSIVKDRTQCMSYHDGNIAQMMSSPFFPSGLRRAAERAFIWEKQVYEGLDAIFTMSEYLRRSFIEDFGVSPNRVWNVGAGPNFEIPQELPPKDYSAKKVLFVGVDFDRKGGPQLLEAFGIVRQAHPHAELHLVGPKSPPEALKEHGKGVVFHGFLSRQDAAQREAFFRLMRESTLFVMPSRYEPFGLAVVEAMVYGMPVVATNRWAFPEIIGDTGVTVESDDVAALADRIGWVLASPDRRSELGRKARARGMDKFRWDQVADRMIAVAEGTAVQAEETS